MNPTRGQVTRLRTSAGLRRDAVPSVEDPASEGKVPREVEEERELKPPERVAPVHVSLPRLDECEIHRDQPREQQDHGDIAEEPEDQHAPSLRQNGPKCKPARDAADSPVHNPRL